MQSFITQVVNQLALNLKRIEAMGARRIAVTGLQPLGCLPRATAVSAFQQCNNTENAAVNFHNLLLQQAVAKLNNESNSRKPVFTILDLYTSFTTALKNKGNHPGAYVYMIHCLGLVLPEMIMKFEYMSNYLYICHELDKREYKQCRGCDI